jgi:5-formyltetrahydrofolate cyclo-ligase
MESGAVTKQELRQQAWKALRAAGAARFPGVEGRIPNFVGAEDAAARLAATDAWRAARVLKCNPDSPQLPVRSRALREGKTIYMAVPRLAEAKPFLRLDPEALTVSPHRAASIKGSAAHGEPVGLDDMERIDLVVCGCVGVERSGARLGKGGGYSDIEFALATEHGLIDIETVVTTTVHPSQFFDEDTIPITDHDFPLDLIATPEGTTRTHTRLRRPVGIIPDELDAQRRAAIPVLSGR